MMDIFVRAAGLSDNSTNEEIINLAADAMDAAADEIERLRKMFFDIRGKIPLDLLRDEYGDEKPLVDAVDAMLVEIVSLRHKLHKELREKE